MREWQTVYKKNPVNKTVNNSKEISREPLGNNTIKNKDFSIVEEQLIPLNRLPCICSGSNTVVRQYEKIP